MNLDAKALRSIIVESGISFKENRASFILTCPRCSKLQKLYIRKIDGKFTCWSCSQTEGFYGRAEYALSALLEQPASSFTHTLYGTGEVDLTEFWSPEITNFYDNDNEKPDVDGTKIEPISWPSDFYAIEHPNSVKGLEYLESRGISRILAAKYGIKFCRRYGRVYFPLEFGGVLYGWQGRSITDNGKFKILSSSNIPRASQLMFSTNLTGSKHAVLTEGPVDAIKADLCGGNVCSMGKVVTPTQFGALLNAGIKRVYLALDPDAMSEAALLMSEHYEQMEFYSMIAPSGYKDIGEMEPEEVLQLKNTATRMNPGIIYTYFKNHYPKQK